MSYQPLIITNNLLTMEMHICKDVNDLSIEAANWITGYIQQVLQHSNRFTIALSGGSTPKKLHLLLVSSPYREKIDWSKLHIFWGDERAVPSDDDRNNAKMAYDTLLNHVPVPAEQIHVMRTDIDPIASAKEYEQILHQYFPQMRRDDGSTFDLVLLGMGGDGHTLSLFPGQPVIHEEKKLATAFYLKEQDMYRITLTAPVVNRAVRIAFLVAGNDKAAALKEVMEGDYRPDTYPSQVIRPLSGELCWFLDKAAASLLH